MVQYVSEDWTMTTAWELLVKYSVQMSVETVEVQ